MDSFVISYMASGSVLFLLKCTILICVNGINNTEKWLFPLENYNFKKIFGVYGLLDLIFQLLINIMLWPQTVLSWAITICINIFKGGDKE